MSQYISIIREDRKYGNEQITDLYAVASTDLEHVPDVNDDAFVATFRVERIVNNTLADLETDDLLYELRRRLNAGLEPEPLVLKKPEPERLAGSGTVYTRGSLVFTESGQYVKPSEEDGVNTYDAKFELGYNLQPAGLSDWWGRLIADDPVIADTFLVAILPFIGKKAYFVTRDQHYTVLISAVGPTGIEFKNAGNLERCPEIILEHIRSRVVT